MKVLVLSDIHLERWKYSHSIPECDVVVLAGDVAPGLDGIDWINDTFSPNVEIVLVAGNHEFYHESMIQHYDRLHTYAETCMINFLQNRSVVIKGVRFIGATLWCDFKLYGMPDIAKLQAPKVMNDYICIRYDESTLDDELKPYHIESEFQFTKQFIHQELLKPFDGPTVVVTHHAPSEQSIDPQYLGHPTSVYYASRLENMILDTQPTLWVHGHIHQRSDYFIDKTRIIANPRGTDVFPNKDFDPNLIIEL
jgi:Icc-related predicted phosphoesterase